jgi:acetoin utilization protein AcuB
MQHSHELSHIASHDLIVVHWLDSMEHAFALMKSRGVRHLPVVDENSGIVGIVSERDFARAMQVDQPDFVSGKVAQAEFDPNARVRDYMSWPIEVIEEGKTIADAAREMLRLKISSLLVARGREAIGIITSDDLLRTIVADSETKLTELGADVKSVLYNQTLGRIVQTISDAGI